MSSLVTGSPSDDVAAVESGVRRRRRWPIITWALLIGWVVLLVATAILGARPTSWGDLWAEVDSGEVSSVEIVGGLSAGSQGFAVTEVRWRDGLVGRVATVSESRPLSAAPNDNLSGRPAVTDVAATLTDLQPGLSVERMDGMPSSSGLLGWSVPDSLLGAQTLLAFLTVCLLLGSPRVARATRWAWFWLLVLVPPIGVAGFLVVGAEGAPLMGRGPEARRLTGGWAFLLGLTAPAVVALVAAALL